MQMWDGTADTRFNYYTKSEPPALPRTHNSKAYPRYLDRDCGNILDAGYYGYPPIDQLTAHNQQILDHECKAFYEMKAENSKEFRQNNSKARPYYCKICSEVPMLDTGMLRAFYHRHHSSLMDRICTRELDAFGRYVCEPCGPDSEVHPVKFGARIPVVLSSSTLHRPFKNSSRGQDIHVDWCTIPGGQVNTLAHAFRALYGKSCRPVDVLVVVGLNDIGKGNSADTIFKRYMRLKATVLEICPRHITGQSTFAIATLPHPPIYSAYDTDIHEPTRDCSEALLRLTEKIIVHNIKAPQVPFPVRKAPQFHKYGVKMRAAKKSETTLLRKVPSRHRMSQWREEEDNRKLHLVDTKKEKMAVACVEYFKDIYGVCTCLPDMCVCV